MVKLTAVEEHNARFTGEEHAKRVGVFVAATHGIGASTLQAMASILDTPTSYVVGRSATRFARQLETLQRVNPEAKIVFILADVSLIKGVDNACAQIKAAESHIDDLCMSPGYLPIRGAHYTTEGLETSFVLSYYARMRFDNNFVPLLNRSPSPRVLSILNGGKGSKLREDDLGLIKSWSAFGLVQQTTTLTTLAFYHLTKEEELITFMHAAPGLVETTAGRSQQPTPVSFLWEIALFFLLGFLSVIRAFTAISAEDSGKRHAYELTSDRFGPGVWLADDKCEAGAKSALVCIYREGGWTDRVWDFTVGNWESIL